MAIKTLIFLSFFCLLCISTSTPTNNLLNDAVDALSNSGFNSMSLTLEFGSRSIITPPFPDFLTIFAPSDKAFTNSGQPSLDLLRFHFSPISFSFKSLRSASKIPTFWSNHSALVTFDGPDHGVLINGVKIKGSPVYDDGSLVIFGIDNFFDPNFQIQDSTPTCPVLDGGNGGPTAFDEARNALRSKGYSQMAAFLGLQMTASNPDVTLTVFAPTDESLMIGNMSSIEQIVKSHIVPCMLNMDYLISKGENNGGLSLSTFLDGFFINVTTAPGGNVTLNGRVQITAPAIYNNTSLTIIHGLNGSLIDKQIMDIPPAAPPLSPAIPTQASCASYKLAVYMIFFGFIVVTAILIIIVCIDRNILHQNAILVGLILVVYVVYVVLMFLIYAIRR